MSARIRLQEFVLHVIGQMTTTLTPGCDFFTGIHVPAFNWATLEKEIEIGGPVFASKDAREGPRAFKEKRKPVYTGQ